MSKLIAGQGKSPEEQIKAFYESLSRDVAGLEPPEVVVDRYHTEDVVQVSDGITIDRSRLIDHIGPLRAQGVSSVRVDVHQVLATATPQGQSIAGRLTLRAPLRKREVVTELHLFATFADDGRMRRAHILTRVADPQGDTTEA